MKKLIRIALAEDHDLFREGLVSLLNGEKGINLLLEVSNGEELLEGLKTHEVDVVLLHGAQRLQVFAVGRLDVLDSQSEAGLGYISSIDQSRHAFGVMHELVNRHRLDARVRVDVACDLAVQGDKLVAAEVVHLERLICG